MGFAAAAALFLNQYHRPHVPPAVAQSVCCRAPRGANEFHRCHIRVRLRLEWCQLKETYNQSEPSHGSGGIH